MDVEDSNLQMAVKAVRKQLDFSLEKFARELGVSFTTVNRWEKEKVKPFESTKLSFKLYCNRMIRKGKITDNNLINLLKDI